MSEKLRYLSKTKVMTGLQCEKALYLSLHEPDLAEENSVAQEAIFKQGHLVGAEAQKLYPDGVVIPASYTEPEVALKDTAAAIESGALTIFEGTFVHDGILVKADILHRATVKSAWELIEVKSSTSVKEQHVPDAALQAWVIERAGLKLKSVSILHVDSKFVSPDDGEQFKRVDVSNDVAKIQAEVVAAALNFRTLLKKAGVPKVGIGPHCHAPYECAFKDHCWGAAKVPSPSVFDLPNLRGDRAWELYGEGKVKLSDLDPSEFTALQQRVIASTLSGERSVDRAAIRAALKEWVFPLYYLDFETMAWAIPRFPGTSPYQQIPFQFSCHSQMKAGGPLIHTEYLPTDGADPRGPLVEALLGALGTTGSIVAYNKGFEARMIRELAKLYPRGEKGKRLRALEERLVDPLPIVRATVYDPRFIGSFSIKSVAPALLGKAMSYEDLDVAGGAEAQVAYAELIADETPVPRKAALRKGLLEYCKRDTLAMVGVVEWLRAGTDA